MCVSILLHYGVLYVEIRPASSVMICLLHLYLIPLLFFLFFFFSFFFIPRVFASMSMIMIYSGQNQTVPAS